MSESTDPGCFPSTATGTGPYRPSATLPLGKWHVMSNGRIHELTITSVSGSEVEGKYNGELILSGKWDGATQKLTFYRQVVTARLIQYFEGYLMQYQSWDTQWRIAGVFIGTAPAPPPDGPRAGWYATISRTEGAG